MKRMIALLLGLLLLSAAALGMIGSSILRQKDQVTVTEQVLYGDPAHAKGASFLTEAHYDNHLFWKTSYTVGKDEAYSTEYDFSAKERPFSETRSYRGISLGFDMQNGVDLTTPAAEQSGLMKAYRELYDETPSGTKGTKIVFLQDYYDYYPIRIDISLPGTLWMGDNYEHLADKDYENERAVWDAFREFFRIPVPDDLPGTEISVVKDESGRSIGVGSHTPSEKDGYYFLYSEAAYTADRCFFSINIQRGEGDGVIDTSLIPGGYGIYSFSYTNVRNKENTPQENVTIHHPGYRTGVDADSLAMVYPLDESVSVRSMHVSPDETRLLLLTEEASGVWLTVIDLADMSMRQKLLVGDGEHISLHHQDDFMMLFSVYDFSLYAIDGAGNYTLAFSAEQPRQYREDLPHINTYAAMDFDGERLITADFCLEEQYGSMQTCDVFLTVYDKTGLLYAGNYETSLARNPDTSRYNFNCLPHSLDVTWN